MEKFKKVVSVVLKALKDNVVKIILGWLCLWQILPLPLYAASSRDRALSMLIRVTSTTGSWLQV